ncbi:hypothetical protein ACFL12_00885 [Pseudomonadota bacterium]
MRVRLNLFTQYFVTLSFAVLATHPAYACGWWGDGELGRDSNIPILNAPDGTPLEQSISLRSAKLPGEMGYGIAMPDPGRAIPYLLATFGRPVNRIGELKTYGFETVIDLGTSAKSARLHRAETEAVGMAYFNIPIKGDMPSKAQVEQFRDMVVASGDAPVLVYAPTAPLLGATWAAYRISFGTPQSFAFYEGRALGLTTDQEDELRRW